MNNLISKINNGPQDRDSYAWKKLCEYVDVLAEGGQDEFLPLDFLGPELYSQIFTLPETIAKLKAVKKMGLYGSNLKIIPPEIGQMESLEYFDPYTSYNLHWFPYEITDCKKLKDSRISRRALYGNTTNNMLFPNLESNSVRYYGESVHCSICKKQITYVETNQLWVTLWVATDLIPMLVNTCSPECETQLPKAPGGYIGSAHKGGPKIKLKQPERAKGSDAPANIKAQTNTKFGNQVIKLVKKIWE